MKTILLPCIFAAAAGLASGAQAGIIDTGAPTDDVALSSPDDIIGGTFVADANTLDSFTIYLRSTDASRPGSGFYGVVAAVDGDGYPVGPLLWQSSLMSGASLDVEAFTPFSFSPGLALTVGQTYFVGYDAGVFVTSPAASSEDGLDIGINAAGSAVPIRARFNGSTSSQFTTSGQLAAVIVTSDSTDVPAPAALGLLGLGLGMIGARRLRR